MPATVYKIAEQGSPVFTPDEKSILKTLAYFDIFHYPLTKDEIYRFPDSKIPLDQLEYNLGKLLADKMIFFANGFYSLHDNPMYGYRRIWGNKKAQTLLPKAKKVGRFLFRFPFVRAIAISGSLSKNFADAHADMDFFIITKANRLWIARTCMHLFKKFTFLTGNQHCYCMNYYIDEQALLLEDQNIFTAIETKTLLPVCGNRAVQEFFEANHWTNHWLPVCTFREQLEKEPRKNIVKKITEWIFDCAGDRLDNFLMKKTRQRWKKKEMRGKKNEKGQTMGLISDKHFARSNPGGFQEKVLALYEQRLREIGVYV